MEEKMHLWCVHQRKAFQIGDRKIAVFRYITMAPTEESAIALAKSEHEISYQSPSKWWAYDITKGDNDEVYAPCFNIGCYLDDPTDEERAERTARAKARR